MKTKYLCFIVAGDRIICHANYFNNRVSDTLAEFYNLCFAGFYILFILDRSQAQMTCTFYLKMPVKMLDASNQPLAFGHIGTCPQSNGIAFLAWFDGVVRFMRIAPWSASVDE